jgi:hypothetical protein
MVLRGRVHMRREELTAMVDDNAALDMAAVSDAALPGEEAAVARLGEVRLFTLRATVHP